MPCNGHSCTAQRYTKHDYYGLWACCAGARGGWTSQEQTRPLPQAALQKERFPSQAALQKQLRRQLPSQRHRRMQRPSTAAAFSSKQQEELQQSMHWLDTDLGRPQQRRDRLPQHNGVIPGVGLWSLLRDWIGKDLHKLTLPTHLNEPLSDLQRRVEAFEYSELLDEVSCHSLVHRVAFEAL